MSARRRRETLIALLAVGGVVAAAILTVVVFRGGEPQPPALSPATSTTPPTTTTKKADERLPRALVVKIDNVSAARPQTGLSRADAIYVEPVEGGLTRLLAVYWGKRPSVIGPVRSARETDIELLGQIKRPVLAYSGAASQLAPSLNKAQIVRASPKTEPQAFSRSQRPSPHNLYVKPNRLPSTKPIGNPLTSTSSAPPGGKRKTTHSVSYQSARYDFRWSKGPRVWSVSMDGRPMETTEKGRLTADTVVVQRVRIVTGLGISDSAGGVSPVAKTVGKGKATVLRDGRVYQGTWSRASAKEPTTFRTGDGDRLPLADGTVWVLLVPA